MQIKILHKNFQKLHHRYGDSSLSPIYGCGCIKNPRVMFIFMNPTARNVSAQKNWRGIRAPWLGTKNVWRLFYETKFISKNTYEKILHLKSNEWTPLFSEMVYREVANNGGYSTNLAKCTQSDARPLKDIIFKKYLNEMRKEIQIVNPKNIITFGNQVSSIIVGKSISVGMYKKDEKEEIVIKNKVFLVYPTHYPVGQGMRNLPLAVKRIREIIKN